MRRLFFTLLLTLAAAGAAQAAYAADGEEPPKTALVLSGGGARGFAHIGVLRALEELGIQIDVVAATSMGAMVGGGFAAGYTPEEIARVTKAVDWAKMFAPRADRPSLTWRRKADDLAGIGAGEVGVSANGVSFPAEVMPTQELDIFLARVTQPVSRINNLSELSIPFAGVATDLVTGAKVVLQEGVTLSKAMRASMSIPGAFAPVPYGKALLVDGGLTDNLPVDQARAMGAERVIAVNVGTPLFGREKLESVFGIMGQMVNILTEQNVRASIASLTDRDILITPDLSDFTAGDFNAFDAIERAGYEAVMKHRAELERFRVSPGQYQKWRSRVLAGLTDNAVHHVTEVRVEGLKTVNPETVLRDADLDISKPVTDEDVARSARRIWADGDFRSVPYRFEPGPRNTEVLVFEPDEKSWGYSVLRFGGNVQFDADRTHSFNVILAHTWGWLNDWGAEWRTELQFGETRRAKTEWYQPLGAASPWYVLPRIEAERTGVDLYADNDGDDIPYARYNNTQVTADVSLGYEFGRLGTASVSAGYMRLYADRDIGAPGLKYRASAPFAGAEVNFDTLDNVNFPRSGFLLNAQVHRLFNPDVNDGVSRSTNNTVYTVEGVLPVVLNDDWSMILSGRYGVSTLPGIFTLGGVFNLSGSPYGRFSGDHMALGRVMLMRSIATPLKEKGIALYAGMSYEVGRAYNDTAFYAEESREWKQAGSVFLGADTWIGPMYMVLGQTFGRSTALTFYWGRLH